MVRPFLDREINNWITIIIDVGVETSIRVRGSFMKEKVNIKDSNT